MKHKNKRLKAKAPPQMRSGGIDSFFKLYIGDPEMKVEYLKRSIKQPSIDTFSKD